MLGGKFKFVKVNEVKGKNKNDQDFHFANVTISDGLESKEFGLDMHLLGTVNNLKRGQDVFITTDEQERGYNHSISITDIRSV